MSKFDAIAQAAQARKTDKQVDGQKAENSAVQTSESSGSGGGIPPAPAPAAVAQPEARKMGRPKGKKSDPSYAQVTVYLPADLYQQGRDEVHRLSRGPKEQRKDFSEIVAEALRAHFRNAESAEL